ncbi:MAG: HAMP domain-containing sensor histidine kinase, partial [Terrisporobacter sp.]
MDYRKIRNYKGKKLNLNKKLIFYLSLVMIAIIFIMAISINFTVCKKFTEYTSLVEGLPKNNQNTIDLENSFISYINNLIIGISLLMIIVGIYLSVFLSQKISKPIIVVSKMTDSIKKGGYDQKLEYDSSILEIDNLINSINNLAYELNHMEKMRKRLTSDISHELRTPLTSIQTHLEAIIDGIWEPTEERLNSVNEEVIRLSHLVNQLKNLAKFDNEKNVLNLSNTNLTQLIKNIIYNNESYALEKDIKINSDLEDININIDKEKISQVIVNLISNAIRYTCEDGNIFIKSYKKNDEVKIHVIDNGRGIPKESLA